MGAQHIAAYKLLRIKPNSECCDCSKEVDDAQKRRFGQFGTLTLFIARNVQVMRV
jgi:hypothetical protein